MQATSVEFHLPTRDAVDFKNLAEPSEQLQALTAHLLTVVLALKSFAARYADMVEMYFSGPPAELLEGDIGAPDDRRFEMELLSEEDDLFLRIRRTDTNAPSVFCSDWLLLKAWRPDYSGFLEQEYFGLADSFHCALYKGLGHVLTEVSRAHMSPAQVTIKAWLTSPDLHGQSGFLCVQPTSLLGQATTFRQELGVILRDHRRTGA